MDDIGSEFVVVGAEAAQDPGQFLDLALVEQVARLKLPQPHVVTLEPRPMRGGPSATNMRELVGNAVRFGLRDHRVAAGFP